MNSTKSKPSPSKQLISCNAAPIAKFWFKLVSAPLYWATTGNRKFARQGLVIAWQPSTPYSRSPMPWHLRLEGTIRLIVGVISCNQFWKACWREVFLKQMVVLRYRPASGPIDVDVQMDILPQLIYGLSMWGAVLKCKIPCQVGFLTSFTAAVGGQVWLLEFGSVQVPGNQQ